MGRMLETLRKGDPSYRSAAKTTPAPQPVPDDCVLDWTMDPAEVPFIEVGGPKKAVDASPVVLAIPHAAHQPELPAPHLFAPKPGFKTVTIAAVSEPKPMTVALESWKGGAASAVEIAPEVIAYHQPTHGISKQYTALAEAMLAGMKKTASPTVLLSGVRANVGASTALANLAVALSAAGKRQVVLLDADTARPRLSEKFGASDHDGLAEVLAGTTAIEQALRPTAVSSLHLLAAAAKPVDLSAMLKQAMPWMLAWLKERFDVVLLQGPDCGDMARVAVLAPHCDAVFLVLPHGETLAKDIPSAVARAGGRLQGLLHTHFE